ncbi:pyridoxal-phosphate dependent enzyme [Nonomuraea diastatica]|uniref:pyridoxal-phosphate dependent enzyme n=1 Tax=Nonomuraea diastatica TaxID=1848329 RepID=UPI001C70ACC0|nr:pyridoxal-phosphate dependent enzyme [Nonomuraea diastatica]
MSTATERPVRDRGRRLPGGRAGIERLAMPTNGNAGAAGALYGARAGLAATVVMPVDAPEITRRECVASGTDLHLVDGLISDAGRMVGEWAAASGGRVFDTSTLKEPYRIEGKKTMGIEIAEQLGWRTPDVIRYPTGGKVGLIGIHKALNDGLDRGPAASAGRRPGRGLRADRTRVRAGARESRRWDGPGGGVRLS